MEILDILLVLCLFVIGFIILGKFFYPQKKDIKSTEVKKAEIIAQYEQRMKKVVSADLSKEQKLLQKTALLKTISQELSVNIFFDKDEVKQIIQKLANIN